jgi:membrane-bound lytic murein transglycosylase B
MLADRAKAMTLSQWEQLGLKRANSQPFPHSADKAYLLAPPAPRGRAF